MSERQLPWHVRRPSAEYGQFTVWDDAGHVVCVCLGEDEGRDEAVVIATLANRAGDQVCTFCDEPATCFGSYEDEFHPGYHCDRCCGHGNEDGHCEPVANAGNHDGR